MKQKILYRQEVLLKKFNILDIWNYWNNFFFKGMTKKYSYLIFIWVAFYASITLAVDNNPVWNESPEGEAMMLENRRGLSAVHSNSPINPGLGSPLGRLETDGGSVTGNYNIEIPIIGLPGRGIDLNLSAKFNSQVWSMSNVPSSEIFRFNRDRDWPVPGLNIGFGKLSLDYEKLIYPNRAMWISSNGSRQKLSDPSLEVIDGKWTGKITSNYIDGTKGHIECPAVSQGCLNSDVAYVHLENGKKNKRPRGKTTGY